MAEEVKSHPKQPLLVASLRRGHRGIYRDMWGLQVYQYIPKGPRTQLLGLQGPNTMNMYLGVTALLFGSLDL